MKNEYNFNDLTFLVCIKGRKHCTDRLVNYINTIDTKLNFFFADGSELHQREIINFASKINIRINAFYIMGLEEDTEISCNETIDYSLSLDTYMARYSVCTPYPGTGYFEDLDKKERLTKSNLSSFNQQELVYDHKNLNDNLVKKLIQKAYIKYYFRPKIIYKILKQNFER